MADLTHQALRAAQARPPAHRRGAARRALVAGGGGVLGAAVLEALLASRVFAQVGVLVTQPLGVAMGGLVPVAIPAAWDDPPPADAEDTAVVVFDRERHANGRERAFLRPEPGMLPALAAHLHARGAKHLVVVLPHAPASLPEALKRGLADLDEQAVAALGFEHVLLLRSAQPPAAVRAASVWQRVADGVLAQMRLMVPLTDQPVRAVKVAAFALALAEQLPAAPPGTRVVPPEVVWLAAQVRGSPATLARAWLHGESLPEASAPKRRF